jgi:hypothetical protein
VTTEEALLSEQAGVEGIFSVGADIANGKGPIGFLRMGFDVDANESTLGGNAPGTCTQRIDNERFQ